jgi:DHA2 family multidrug resistance protein-like MFS transporter
MPSACTPRPATCSGSSDAYSLVLAALILPAGLLGDRYGRKRVLLVALVLFGAASACALTRARPAS